MSEFARRLVLWQSKHGRRSLPWQGTRDPYRIWLSEIMLQQTQVATVIPYYERFLARFPAVRELAVADIDAVLTLWSGLGYYSRARNLHAAARAVMSEHGGSFPSTRAGLESLPGVGRSTAAAIAAFAFGEREAILDGNVKRVLARQFAVRGHPGSKHAAGLWRLAESLLPRKNIEIYTQALMDLGATVCTRVRPRCERCPVSAGCRALALGRIADYPQARPRKAVPVRSTAMLLLLRQGEVLLEKRPPAGVWGGLWCLPEMPRDDSALRHCALRFGAEISHSEKMPVLRHGFTHFTLNITPVVCQVAGHAGRGRIAAEPGLVWLPPEEAIKAAVPVPVKKLLGALRAVSRR